MSEEKVCKATCLTGDLYDIFYPDGSMDSEVPGHYINGLLRDGWTVQVYDRETKRRETWGPENAY